MVIAEPPSLPQILGTGALTASTTRLYELQETVSKLGMNDAADLLRVMVDGNRLKDISTLTSPCEAKISMAMSRSRTCGGSGDTRRTNIR